MTTLHITCLAAAFFSVLGISNGYDLQTDYTHNTDFAPTKEKRAYTYSEEDTNSEKDSENNEEPFITYSNKNNFQDALSRNRMRRSNDKFNESLDSLLKTLSESLEKNSTMDSVAVLNESNFLGNMHDDEDRCQRWLDAREKIEAIFPGSINDLPSCPCRYPNDIVYENMIWDKKRRMKFRWRDASSDSQRLNVYKPGAAYCLRSFPSATSTGAQHCCYDENRKLLTRGSGAGTPYVVSPDVSYLLHDKIDLTPWRLCKGDFTRYNKVRVPNNDNNCKINPKEEEYQLQIKEAKDF